MDFAIHFPPRRNFVVVRNALDTFNFLRHVMRAILSVRPKCSHRCVSLKEAPLKPVQILKHTTNNSTEQTVMRTKWFKYIAIDIVQVHLLSGFCCDLFSKTAFAMYLRPCKGGQRRTKGSNYLE